MASVVLDRADIALMSDLAGSRVVIQYLQAQPVTRGWDQASVRFEGSQWPTTFRGEGRSEVLAVTCMWPQAEQDGALALLNLLDAAQFGDVDGRLLLRTAAGQVPGLDPARIVTVAGVTDDPQMGLYRTVTFTATRVG